MAVLLGTKPRSSGRVVSAVISEPPLAVALHTGTFLSYVCMYVCTYVFAAMAYGPFRVKFHHVGKAVVIKAMVWKVFPLCLLVIL